MAKLTRPRFKNTPGVRVRQRQTERTPSACSTTGRGRGGRLARARSSTCLAFACALTQNMELCFVWGLGECFGCEGLLNDSMNELGECGCHEEVPFVDCMRKGMRLGDRCPGRTSPLWTGDFLVRQLRHYSGPFSGNFDMTLVHRTRVFSPPPPAPCRGIHST